MRDGRGAPRGATAWKIGARAGLLRQPTPTILIRGGEQPGHEELVCWERFRAVYGFPSIPNIQWLGDVAVLTFHLGARGRLGRRTLVWRRTADGWRIAHLHASSYQLT